MKSCCVFCGSSVGARDVYRRRAEELGRELARRGIRLVYGGADVGLMGAVANAVLEAGGEAMGVIPRGLAKKEVMHHGLTELHIVESLHERKSMMSAAAEGFIALPGGMGTFEELLETLTWAQLGIHSRPVGVLDVDGYYEPLRVLLERAANERFLREEHRGLLMVADQAPELLDRMIDYRAVHVTKWLDRHST